MIKESRKSRFRQWKGEAGMSNIVSNEKGITKCDTINSDRIQSCIYTIRGLQVMLDSDLAELYRIEVKALNQAVRRNIERFPVEFMFQLTDDEHNSLKSQFVTLETKKSLRSQIVTSNQRGGRRYLPYVFTEQGVAMLSAVLRSEIAVRTSIQIINAFVAMRRFITSNARVFYRLDTIERKQLEHKLEAEEKFRNSRDRFIIIDGNTDYHFGASLKDLGKKWFAFSKMDIGAAEMLANLKKVKLV